MTYSDYKHVRGYILNRYGIDNPSKIMIRDVYEFGDYMWELNRKIWSDNWRAFLKLFGIEKTVDRMQMPRSRFKER